MARPNYGPADHCRFNDYPKKIRLVVGQLLAENSDLFDYGQTVVLQQTSNSGVLQGDKVVGEELPKKAMIYTDTGLDDSFNLKIEYYGWGEFYLKNAGDECFSLDITKGMTVKAADWDKEECFQAVRSGKTKIPNSKDMQEELHASVSITRNYEIEVPVKEDDTTSNDVTVSDSSSDGGGGDGGGSDDDSIKDTGQPHCIDVYQDVDDDGRKELVGQYCYLG